jgi:hypothetical protein
VVKRGIGVKGSPTELGVGERCFSFWSLDSPFVTCVWVPARWQPTINSADLTSGKEKLTGVVSLNLPSTPLLEGMVEAVALGPSRYTVLDFESITELRSQRR